MAGRKFYSEEYRKKTIEAYLSRDCTRNEFLKKCGVSGSTLDKWVYKHRKPVNKPKRSDAQNANKSTFVPISIPRSEKSSQGKLRSVNIEIPGGTRLSFSGEFSLSDISSIVSQLNGETL